MKQRQVAGIVLAAGKGARMAGLAVPFSKTLLPVADLPVVAYAARPLASFVDEIVLVTNPATSESVLAAVENSTLNHAKKITAVIQPAPAGVADAIAVGISALESDSAIVVICGDNIIIDEQNIPAVLDCVRSDAGSGTAAEMAWTYREFETSEAKRFAVWDPEGSPHGKLIEKPQDPPSAICWCGPIAFRSSDDVGERISRLTPSARGELEVTDLMNSYIINGEARRFLLKGLWFDIGSESALAEAREALTRHCGKLL